MSIPQTNEAFMDLNQFIHWALPGDSGAETAGTALQRQAQTTIHEHRAWLMETRGLCSLGRSVAVFLPDFNARGFRSLLPRFKRVLALGTTSALDAADHSVRRAGASVSHDMHLVQAEAATYFSTALDCLATPTEAGIHQSMVPADMPTARLREIQSLLETCGLTPLPGGLLRGRHGPVATVILQQDDGTPVGAATAVDLSSAGPDHIGTSMILAGAVSPEFQGRGLGARLIAAAAVAAHTRLGARRIIGVVDPGNIRAMRMNARFGLVTRPGQAARYLECKRTAL